MDVELTDLAESIRADMAVCPPVVLDPVVAAVTAALSESRIELDDATIGAVLMTAATAASRTNVSQGEFLSASSMALALAAAGLQLHDSASARQAD
ncbi:hypothetical protein [Streptacidiphilus jiangxiensis]|uniref:Uncharacterized protein n=1 Tax=Streptacidiphilus jiangxiensis TaxID=235985 RepID=A0A1H8B9W7_STRJI|nr:hypothetical protein [Streptacidiphilus jiangxiensis]SEM78874.1 hypothetical protein SAMN05414137_1592 [Streptacidiphilus jiangxiensis]